MKMLSVRNGQDICAERSRGDRNARSQNCVSARDRASQEQSILIGTPYGHEFRAMEMEEENEVAISSMDTCITELENQVLSLGTMVESSISRVLTALTHHDTMMAKAIIQEDADIDRIEVEVHEQCLAILETERPSGTDLRFVVAVLKINDSLERIGDLAENIAHVVVEVGDWERFQGVPGIRQMAEESAKNGGDVPPIAAPTQYGSRP